MAAFDAKIFAFSYSAGYLYGEPMAKSDKTLAAQPSSEQLEFT